jgi:tRNA(Arg) A34 adenosine deaminase TadA
MHRRRIALTLLVLSLSLGLVSCHSLPEAPRSDGKVQEVSTPEQAERDEIFGLLAYAVALRNWQGPSREERGHNIAAVLVDPKGVPVAWGRNCNEITQNTTQHAEIRLIRSYLTRSRALTLRNYSVYTTLEPCAMCAGMMTMCNLKRVVYGQTDPDFGGALRRLQLDSRSLPQGLPPYPRTVVSEPLHSNIRTKLDEAHTQAFARGEKSITRWLLSEPAHELFQEAARRLDEYQTRCPGNAAPLESARTLLKEVPAKYVPFED